MLRFLNNSLSRGMIVAASGWLLAACSATDATPTGPAHTPNSAAFAASAASAAHAAKATSKTAKTTATSDATSGTTSTETRTGTPPPPVTVLTFKPGVNTSGSARKVIGAEGGYLTLAATGFTLVVPPGAVRAPTTFSVTPIGGDVVAYDFEPHGTKFAVPLTFMQDLAKTNYVAGKTIRGGYFADRSHIDTTTKKAQVSELFTISFDGFGWSFFSITHFSGYLVSMA
jgi:ZU5 domain